ncbi:MAG TPA: 1-acyl-sn-glycerol-3-phosphate acyltransferase [Abditibacteriaceae bacterium]|jgi:1-acyl-sn-glycerol-3-phosphate acyltransferase
MTKPDKKSPPFRPPIESPRTRALVNLVMRPMLRFARGVQRVEIAGGDLKRLKALKNERVVLTPNHPTNTDPALMLELSRRAGMPFYYLACREAFDHWNGLWGALIQRIGAYSVVRGTPDRASFAFTKELLARPGAKLVLFPEGEVYSQNDSLLPFQTGAVQLALWGREAARKTEPNAQVHLLPCALRYRFLRDVTPVLHQKLGDLEEHLKLGDGPKELYPRMRRVALRVFEEVEREYGLTPQPGGDITPRLQAAKEAALMRAAQLFGIGMPRGTLPERMRALLHEVETALHDLDEEHMPHDTQGWENKARNTRRAWRDLQRLANWIAVYDGYAQKAPTPEHIAEVIYRLEIEVFGSATHAGVRIARVRVGQPIPLPEKVSRKELPALTLQLEQAIAELLRI